MKGHTGKKAVNRHQTQSKTSAGAQERSIERRERQKAKKVIAAELKEDDHAGHWRGLAKQERERPSWDKHYLPAIAEAKAKMFEDTALAIEKGDATGIPYCACHLIPLTACAERKLAQVRR